MILYSVYKNLGSKNEPDWSETPLHEGLSEQKTIHGLISELGSNSDTFRFLVNYKLIENEATTIVSDSRFVVDALIVDY